VALRGAYGRTEGKEAAGGSGRASSSSVACVLVREASVFRNTFERRRRGWSILAKHAFAKTGHPSDVRRHVLRDACESPRDSTPGASDAGDAAGAPLTATLLPSMRPYAPRSTPSAPRTTPQPPPRAPIFQFAPSLTSATVSSDACWFAAVVWTLALARLPLIVT
jgi:hypothetical protein